MPFYESSASINADPARIWEILVDGSGYTTWDSGVLGVEGSIAPGEKIKVTSSANPNRAFPVKVVEFRPGEQMTWEGGMPLGLFKGTRVYRLTPGEDGTTEFHMREDYTGPLAGMMSRQIPDLQPSFDQFAHGLKVRAEGGD